MTLSFFKSDLIIVISTPSSLFLQVVEEMGGEFASVCISAKNKTNLDKLEDAFYRKYTFFDTRNVFFRYRTSCNLAFKLKIAF